MVVCRLEISVSRVIVEVLWVRVGTMAIWITFVGRVEVGECSAKGERWFFGVEELCAILSGVGVLCS